MTDYEAYAYGKSVRGTSPRQRSWTYVEGKYDTLAEIVLRNAQVLRACQDDRFTLGDVRGKE